MTHEHEQYPPAGPGHLTFATGGTVSGDAAAVLEPGPAPFTVPEAALHSMMPEGTTVEVVPGSYEEFARHAAAKFPLEFAAARGRRYERNAPAGARMMPSGNWVVVKDPHSLTRGDKRELIRRGQTVDEQDPAGRIFLVQDLVHQKLITAWSYPHPLPSQDPASLDLLPAEDDDALDGLIAEVNALLFPKPVSVDDYADPNSPTAPSGE